MLGKALISHFQNFNELEVLGVGREEFDISRLNIDKSIDANLFNLLQGIKPEVIVNCAAIVSLDLCEKNQLLSEMVNTYFPEMLAFWCDMTGAKLVQISTDHLYYESERGRKLLHDEGEQCSIANNYAKQKLLAENKVKSVDKNALIIRANIIGCRLDNKHNTFIEWACRELIENRELNGFIDYYTTPIYVHDLATILLKLIKWNYSGIINIASNKAVSKYDCLVYMREILVSTSTVRKVKAQCGTSRSLHNGLSTKKIESIYENLGHKWEPIIPFDTLRRAVLEYKDIYIDSSKL